MDSNILTLLLIWSLMLGGGFFAALVVRHFFGCIRGDNHSLIRRNQ